MEHVQSALPTIRIENNIEFGDTDKKPKKIDMSLLRMSDSLKDQIELKLNLLQS